MKNILPICLIIVSASAFAQNAGSTWKIFYVRDLDRMENVSAKKGTVLINIAENSISGAIGCHQFKGLLDYTKGDLIKPIKAVANKTNCPAKIDRSETAVMDALNASNKLVIDRDRAKFYKADKLMLELNR